MAIKQFLNSSKEEVDDKFDQIFEKIVKTYNTGDRTYETDEEDIFIPRISYAEVFQAL